MKPVDCSQWQPGPPGGGACAAGHVKGTVSFGHCVKHCPHRARYASGPVNREMPKLPPVTMGKLASFATAALTGDYVAEEIRREREEICRQCDRVVMVDSGQRCGVCGCRTTSHLRITNLAAYQENLPYWGCKHSLRHVGQGWRR